MSEFQSARRKKGIRYHRRWLRLESLEERALLVAGLTSEGNQYWHQNVALVQESGEDGDEFGGAAATGDFNGDDYPDLAIGVPGESVAGHLEAGAVNVIYGSFAGLSATNNQLWHQDSEEIQADAETGDHFGAALAIGDFNNDGYDDLAIGVPGDEINGAINAGGVNVIYGSRSGLAVENNQFWFQSLPDIFGDSERDDNFGASLTAGDFNGDRYDDLAIGVPGEDIEGASGAGAVNVIYGSATGLITPNDQRWYQNIPDVEGDSETNDRFGASLAAGDFDGDGFADLAIGVPGDSINGSSNAGGVNVVYGTRNRLATANNQFWYQSLADVDGQSQSNERFGAALVAGEFNGDRFVDLAIGVPGESVDGAHNSGAVNVMYGSRNRLTTDNAQFWHQDVLGIKDQVEAGDRFGESLTAGDFNGDRVDDLAVGVPGESLGNFSEAGAVNVIFGAQLGLAENNNQFWSQESFDIQGAANVNEHFGNALAAGNFDRDAFADLAIGVPFDTVNGGLASRIGAVNVLYGATISPAQIVVEMQGPGGYDPPDTSEIEQQRFVTTEGYLQYRVEVWNDSVAEVAAKSVTLRDGFSDPELLDLDSFELTRIGFLDWDRSLAETQQFETTVDLRPGMNLLVDVTASVDWDDADGDGNLTWELHSIDPATGVAPDELLAGVLPPLNPATEREIAWFEYRVKPKADLPTGTRIENQAFGEFDNNGDWPAHPAPSLGPWVNTIDTGAPASEVTDLPETSPARVELRWAGADDAGGSGIAHYDLYVSDNGGPFELWLDDTNETAATYQGLPEHTYAFYSVATDNVGHQEAPPDSADATTFVQATSCRDRHDDDWSRRV